MNLIRANQAAITVETQSELLGVCGILGHSHPSPPAGHRRFGRNGGQNPKSEIRNPKSETNSNEQRSKSSKPSRRRWADWSGFENFSFGFGACFGFRISDFGFVPAGQRCPAKKVWDVLSLE